MSGKMRIDFIDQGFIDVLKSAGLHDLLESEAQAIAGRAGEGFSAEVLLGTTRYNAVVHSDTIAAAQAEAEYKVLSKSV